MSKKLVTTEVRLSYCHLFEPYAMNDQQDAKYSVCLLVPKSDKKLVKQIQDTIDGLIEENKAGKFKGSAKNLYMPLRDGDDERDGEEYEDHYFINCSSKTKPLVLDENGAEVIDNREVYSGCYARASVNFFAFNTSGNKGVGVALNAIKKTRDGESFGGIYTESEAAADFDDDLM